MIPINMFAPHVGQVSYFKSAAPHYGCRSWREAMRRYCVQHGKAIAHLANDGALIMERDQTRAGGVVIHKMRPDEVIWHTGNYRS